MGGFWACVGASGGRRVTGCRAAGGWCATPRPPPPPGQSQAVAPDHPLLCVGYNASACHLQNICLSKKFGEHQTQETENHREFHVLFFPAMNHFLNVPVSAQRSMRNCDRTPPAGATACAGPPQPAQVLLLAGTHCGSVHAYSVPADPGGSLPRGCPPVCGGVGG